MIARRNSVQDFENVSTYYKNGAIERFFFSSSFKKMVLYTVLFVLLLCGRTASSDENNIIAGQGGVFNKYHIITDIRYEGYDDDDYADDDYEAGSEEYTRPSGLKRNKNDSEDVFSEVFLNAHGKDESSTHSGSSTYYSGSATNEGVPENRGSKSTSKEEDLKGARQDLIEGDSKLRSSGNHDKSDEEKIENSYDMKNKHVNEANADTLSGKNNTSINEEDQGLSYERTHKKYNLWTDEDSSRHIGEISADNRGVVSDLKPNGGDEVVNSENESLKTNSLSPFEVDRDDEIKSNNADSEKNGHSFEGSTPVLVTDGSSVETDQGSSYKTHETIVWSGDNPDKNVFVHQSDDGYYDSQESGIDHELDEIGENISNSLGSRSSHKHMHDEQENEKLNSYENHGEFTNTSGNNHSAKTTHIFERNRQQKSSSDGMWQRISYSGNGDDSGKDSYESGSSMEDEVVHLQNGVKGLQPNSIDDISNNKTHVTLSKLFAIAEMRRREERMSQHEKFEQKNMTSKDAESKSYWQIDGLEFHGQKGNPNKDDDQNGISGSTGLEDKSGENEYDDDKNTHRESDLDSNDAKDTNHRLNVDNDNDDKDTHSGLVVDDDDDKRHTHRGLDVDEDINDDKDLDLNNYDDNKHTYPEEFDADNWSSKNPKEHVHTHVTSKEGLGLNDGSSYSGFEGSGIARDDFNNSGKEKSTKTTGEEHTVGQNNSFGSIETGFDDEKDSKVSSDVSKLRNVSNNDKLTDLSKSDINVAHNIHKNVSIHKSGKYDRDNNSDEEIFGEDSLGEDDDSGSGPGDNYTESSKDEDDDFIVEGSGYKSSSEQHSFQPFQKKTSAVISVSNTYVYSMNGASGENSGTSEDESDTTKNDKGKYIGHVKSNLSSEYISKGINKNSKGNENISGMQTKQRNVGNATAIHNAGISNNKTHNSKLIIHRGDNESSVDIDFFPVLNRKSKSNSTIHLANNNHQGNETKLRTVQDANGEGESGYSEGIEGILPSMQTKQIGILSIPVVASGLQENETTISEGMQDILITSSGKDENEPFFPISGNTTNQSVSSDDEKHPDISISPAAINQKVKDARIKNESHNNNINESSFEGNFGPHPYHKKKLDEIKSVNGQLLSKEKHFAEVENKRGKGKIASPPMISSISTDDKNDYGEGADHGEENKSDGPKIPLHQDRESSLQAKSHSEGSKNYKNSNNLKVVNGTLHGEIKDARKNKEYSISHFERETDDYKQLQKSKTISNGVKKSNNSVRIQPVKVRGSIDIRDSSKEKATPITSTFLPHSLKIPNTVDHPPQKHHSHIHESSMHNDTDLNLREIKMNAKERGKTNYVSSNESAVKTNEKDNEKEIKSIMIQLKPKTTKIREHNGKFLSLEAYRNGKSYKSSLGNKLKVQENARNYDSNISSKPLTNSKTVRIHSVNELGDALLGEQDVGTSHYREDKGDETSSGTSDYYTSSRYSSAEKSGKSGLYSNNTNKILDLTMDENVINNVELERNINSNISSEGVKEKEQSAKYRDRWMKEDPKYLKGKNQSKIEVKLFKERQQNSENSLYPKHTSFSLNTTNMNNPNRKYNNHQPNLNSNLPPNVGNISSYTSTMQSTKMTFINVSSSVLTKEMNKKERKHRTLVSSFGTDSKTLHNHFNSSKRPLQEIKNTSAKANSYPVKSIHVSVLPYRINSSLNVSSILGKVVSVTQDKNGLILTVLGNDNSSSQKINMHQKADKTVAINTYMNNTPNRIDKVNDSVTTNGNNPITKSTFKDSKTHTSSNHGTGVYEAVHPIVQTIHNKNKTVHFTSATKLQYTTIHKVAHFAKILAGSRVKNGHKHNNTLFNHKKKTKSRKQKGPERKMYNKHSHYWEISSSQKKIPQEIHERKHNYYDSGSDQKVFKEYHHQKKQDAKKHNDNKNKGTAANHKGLNYKYSKNKFYDHPDEHVNNPKSLPSNKDIYKNMKAPPTNKAISNIKAPPTNTAISSIKPPPSNKVISSIKPPPTNKEFSNVPPPPTFPGTDLTESPFDKSKPEDNEQPEKSPVIRIRHRPIIPVDKEKNKKPEKVSSKKMQEKTSNTTPFKSRPPQRRPKTLNVNGKPTPQRVPGPIPLTGLYSWTSQPYRPSMMNFGNCLHTSCAPSCCSVAATYPPVYQDTAQSTSFHTTAVSQCPMICVHFCSSTCPYRCCAAAGNFQVVAESPSITVIPQTSTVPMMSQNAISSYAPPSSQNFIYHPSCPNTCRFTCSSYCPERCCKRDGEGVLSGTGRIQNICPSICSHYCSPICSKPCCRNGAIKRLNQIKLSKWKHNVALQHKIQAWKIKQKQKYIYEKQKRLQYAAFMGKNSKWKGVRYPALYCPNACLTSCLSNCPRHCCVKKSGLTTFDIFTPEEKLNMCPSNCQNDCVKSCPTACCNSEKSTKPRNETIEDCPAVCFFKCTSECSPFCCEAGKFYKKVDSKIVSGVKERTGTAYSSCPKICQTKCTNECPVYCCGKTSNDLSCPKNCTASSCHELCPPKCCIPQKGFQKIGNETMKTIKCPSVCYTRCSEECPNECCGPGKPKQVIGSTRALLSAVALLSKLSSLREIIPKSCPSICSDICSIHCERTCCSAKSIHKYKAVERSIINHSLNLWKSQSLEVKKTHCPKVCHYYCAEECPNNCCGPGKNKPMFIKSLDSFSSHTSLEKIGNHINTAINDKATPRHIVLSACPGVCHYRCESGCPRKCCTSVKGTTSKSNKQHYALIARNLLARLLMTCPTKCRHQCSRGCLYYCCELIKLAAINRMLMESKSNKFVTNRSYSPANKAKSTTTVNERSICPKSCSTNCEARCPNICCSHFHYKKKDPSNPVLERMSPNRNNQKYKSLLKASEAKTFRTRKVTTLPTMKNAKSVKQYHTVDPSNQELVMNLPHVPLQLRPKCPAICLKTCADICPYYCCGAGDLQ